MPRIDITLAPSEVAAVAETKHTKGPWYVGAQNDALYIIDKPARPSGNDYPNHDVEVGVIAKVYDGPAAEANARLFAAAPDLLHALRQILQGIPLKRDWLDPDLECMAKGAIAKAESR